MVTCLHVLEFEYSRPSIIRASIIRTLDYPDPKAFSVSPRMKLQQGGYC